MSSKIIQVPRPGDGLNCFVVAIGLAGNERLQEDERILSAAEDWYKRGEADVSPDPSPKGKYIFGLYGEITRLTLVLWRKELMSGGPELKQLKQEFSLAAGKLSLEGMEHAEFVYTVLARWWKSPLLLEPQATS